MDTSGRGGGVTDDVALDCTAMEKRGPPRPQLGRIQSNSGPAGRRAAPAGSLDERLIKEMTMPERTGAELGRQEPPIFGLLRQMQTQIHAALPKHLTPERFARMCFTTLRLTPKLAECDLRSILAAVMELAQLGLEPGTPLGHAWIIPFGKFAQVIVGYKGFVHLAYRSDVVIVAETVYTQDEFAYQPSNVKEPILHRYADTEDRGELRYSYSLAQFPNGRLSYRLCTLADIRKAQEYSQAFKQNKRDCPWFTNPDPMWRKTAIRRHAAVLPLNAEFVRAAELDDTSTRGQIQIFDLTPDDAKQEIIADAIGASLEDVRRELQEHPPAEPRAPSEKPENATAAPAEASKLFPGREEPRQE